MYLSVLKAVRRVIRVGLVVKKEHSRDPPEKSSQKGQDMERLFRNAHPSLGCLALVQAEVDESDEVDTAKIGQQ